MLSVLFAISLFMRFSQADWSFNFPYYLLIGGVQDSVDLPFKKFVTDYGYPVEVHPDIETEDGYLLTLFRIPYGIKTNNSEVKNKPVAFLMHGLLLSSEDWVVLGPEKSLGFILADEGYDVWFGNARGNIHSRKHVKYNPNWNGNFWNFSFHEIGYYDLKAKIDYVLSTTKQEQLFYFGHSQGCTSFLIFISLRPEYNQRIKLMFALGGAVLMGNSQSFGFRAFAISNTIDHLIYAIGIREVPHLKLHSFVGSTFCKIKGLPQFICKKLHFFLSGGVSTSFNQELISKVMQYEVGGAALKQGIHYGHLVNHKRFCHYDYGKKKNLQVYGTEFPPDYNLSNVIAPVAYYYAKHDRICALKDQLDTIELLPNVVDDYLFPYSGFTHMDMVVGDGAVIAYERALKLMQEY